MNAFLKTYKAFFIGLIIFPIFWCLSIIGFIIIPDDSPWEVYLIFMFWYIMLSLFIHNFTKLKRKKKTLLKVLYLIGLLFVALIVDGIMSLPDNPITFILMLSFWIGIVYLLAPIFVTKYWKLIVIFYGPLFLYFVYLRLFTGGLEAYMKLRDEVSFVYFFLPIPILFVLWFYEQWKWLRNLKAEKSQAELALLRTQINPHFFFNTLNNLYALTVKNSKQAPEVILKLSDMMRYTIYEGEKHSVAIADEISYLNNYIELHKIRYKKTVTFKFDQDVDQNIRVAPLLFIILLENAFKHGVETLTENAYIHMHLSNDADHVYFTIENNFDPKEISETHGIGLSNLKRRLALLYPQQHELDAVIQNNIYKSTLKIANHV